MMLDVTAPEHVQVQIRGDGKVVWVNIDGACAFRACRIGEFELTDGRKQVGELCDYCDKELSEHHVEVTGLLEGAEQDVRWFCDKNCIAEFLYHRENPENEDE